MKTNSLISPPWYALGSLFVAPIAAVFCVLVGIGLLLMWPLIPFLCYMQRKEEIRKAENSEP